MKIKSIAIAIISLTAISSTSAPPTNDSAFMIYLEHTPTGVRMVCERGCNWKTLSFDCGEVETCGSYIDANGMAGK